MIKKKKYFKIVSLMLSLLLCIGGIIVPNSYATTINENVKAPINLVKTVEKTQCLLNEEFTINYKIQPQPIPIEDIIPDSYLKDKEIVLVMDTSGSMAWDIARGSSIDSDGKIHTWDNNNHRVYYEQGYDGNIKYYRKYGRWNKKYYTLDKGKKYYKDDRGNIVKPRMLIAKEAAKIFIDKLKEDDKVNISLLSYSNTSSIMNFNGKKLVKLKDNFSSVNNAINNLGIEGGTNIGDGLRRGYYLLKELGNSEARKYIVLMTDGEPTAFTYDEIGGYFQANYIDRYGRHVYKDYYGVKHNDIGTKQEGSSSSPVFGIYDVNFRTNNAIDTSYYVNWTKSGDYGGFSQQYANTIASIIASDNSKIDNNTFIVGFSNDINKNKLQQIANNSNGFYKEAKTAEDINEVYEKLAEQIQSDLPIHGIKFEETFPEEMQIVDKSDCLEINEQNRQTVTGDIGSISYKLNEETKQFEAEPFEFFIKLRGTKIGNYNLGKDSNDQSTSSMNYTDIDGTDGNKSFPVIPISVYEKNPPQISAHLTNDETDENRYKLSLTIDESAKIKVLNEEGTLIWVDDSSYQSSGNLSITLNKSDLIGNYISIEASDKSNNKVVEKVSLINLTWIPDEINIKETMEIVTEENNTITDIKVNEESVAKDKFTDKGRYTQLVDLKENGNNQIEISVMNYFENTTTLKFNKKVKRNISELNIKVTDRDGVVDEYLLNEQLNESNKIFDKAKILQGDSFANINVEGEAINFFEYQFVKNATKPTNSWQNLDLTGEIRNEDVVTTKPGYLNQRSYDVSDGIGAGAGINITEANQRFWAHSDKVFKHPLKATHHKSATYSTSKNAYGKWEDYLKSDGTKGRIWVTNSIFLNNMNIGNDYREASKFWGYIKVPTTGTYKFKGRSDDGCRGYITTNGETKPFVDMFGLQGAKWGNTSHVYNLEAGKYYPIYLEYFNWGGAAAFEMNYSNNGGGWSRVPQKCFYPSKDISPGEYATTIFTGSKGVKFPSESGDYYIAFRTGKDGDVTRKGIYGPFTVNGDTKLNLSKKVIKVDSNKVPEKETFMLEYTIQPENIVPRGNFKNSNGSYKKTISLEGIKLEDEYPTNIEINTDSTDTSIVKNGQKITANFPSITYNLNPAGNLYIADSVKIKIPLKANVSGTYTLSEERNSMITFTDFDGGSKQENFEPISITVVDRKPLNIKIENEVMGDNIVDKNEQNNVTINGRIEGITEGNVNIKIIIKDKNDKQVSGNVTVDGNGEYSVTGIDVSGLAEGYLTIEAVATGESNKEGKATKIILKYTEDYLGDIAITDTKGADSVEIIKNGKLIYKVKIELDRKVKDLKVYLDSAAISKFTMKEIKLNKVENGNNIKQPTDVTFDKDKKELDFPDGLSKGTYECYIRLDVTDNDKDIKPKPREIEKQNEDTEYTSYTLTINSVKETIDIKASNLESEVTIDLLKNVATKPKLKIGVLEPPNIL